MIETLIGAAIMLVGVLLGAWLTGRCSCYSYGYDDGPEGDEDELEPDGEEVSVIVVQMPKQQAPGAPHAEQN